MRILESRQWIWGGISVLFCFSCTQTVRIPNSEIENMKPNEAKYWRITTVDGKRYSVKNMEIQGSIVVIQSVTDQDSKHAELGGFEVVTESELPIFISIDDVDILERVNVDKQKTFLIAGTLVGLFILTLYSMREFAKLGGAFGGS